MNHPPAERMVDAARAWLVILTDEQRHQWYYAPTDHGGLTLANMSPTQQSRALQLLGTGLSKPGYARDHHHGPGERS
jgi:Protein of unknown function (DUF3500)